MDHSRVSRKEVDPYDRHRGSDRLPSLHASSRHIRTSHVRSMNGVSGHDLAPRLDPDAVGARFLALRSLLPQVEFGHLLSGTRDPACSGDSPSWEPPSSPPRPVRWTTASVRVSFPRRSWSIGPASRVRRSATPGTEEFVTSGSPTTARSMPSSRTRPDPTPPSGRSPCARSRPTGRPGSGHRPGRPAVAPMRPGSSGGPWRTVSRPPISIDVGSRGFDPAVWDRALAPVSDVRAELRAEGIEVELVHLVGGFPAPWVDPAELPGGISRAVGRAVATRLGPVPPGRIVVTPTRHHTGELR